MLLYILNILLRSVVLTQEIVKTKKNEGRKETSQPLVMHKQMSISEDKFMVCNSNVSHGLH